MTHAIDLRSDTVTLPGAAMRRAMADAEVGDDQYGEDPSVNRLQDEVAALLGTDAALFLPTGTMANQVALRTLTRPGDDVLVPPDSHLVLHESGAGAANAGVQFSPIGAGGRYSADDVRAAIKPRDHIVLPPTTLLVAENTHNRAGGIVPDQAEVEASLETAREHGLRTYLDGARLLNAAVASGRPAADLARGFDLVSLSLSKGLGAPAGSLLAGSREHIARAHRYRRMAGGAMRQAGILAAAGSYALAHHVERLADDHANAQLLAAELLRGDDVELDPGTVQTNIVIFSLVERRGVPDAPTFVDRCRERGVLLNAFGPRTVRAVTHLDVDDEGCRTAARVMRAVADGR
ncbi:MAG: aminotransferase class I/II-fold pyridoxal phosphate-dependent enzyme [Chloroflexi bacterium]|nr:aminotransferase class I/II-fold pyridoxal phosphate-dependent enzyme [Chloroflexota bacterium]